jgi:hypothetical protein
VSGDASIGTDTLRGIEAVRGTSFNDIYDATGFSGSSANAGSSGTFNQFEGMTTPSPAMAIQGCNIFWRWTA